MGRRKREEDLGLVSISREDTHTNSREGGAGVMSKSKKENSN
jgi:hypothetical protein